METGLRVLIYIFWIAMTIPTVRAEAPAVSDVTVEFDASGRTGMEGIVAVDIAVSLSAKAADTMATTFLQEIGVKGATLIYNQLDLQAGHIIALK